MGNLTLFLKKNKKVKENRFYPATKTLCDENGEPLLWEIKAVTTKETDEIREQCTVEVPIPGKTGMYRPKIDSQKLMSKLMVAAVVFPDLYNTELQDSYNVRSAEDLLKAMVDDPVEYNKLGEFIQSYSDMDESVNDKVEQAKN